MPEGSETRRKSEDVIINAPMSFAGAAQRAFRLRRSTLGLPAAVAMPVMTVVAVSVACVWWMAVLMWYCCFGLLLVPYRLLRRGSRTRKAEARRHREVLDTLEKK